MNEILKTKAKEIISKGGKFLHQFDDTKELIIYSCEALSSIGFLTTNFYDLEYNQEIKNELFNLFIYLYYYDNEKLSEAFANKRNNDTRNVDVFRDTLRSINVLLSDTTQIDHYIYNNIIMICNAVTKELYKYKSTYEDFLVDYIKE